MRRFAVLLVGLASSFAFADEHPVDLLTEEEHAWLESLDRPLIIGSEREYRPYNFINENGEFDGVSGDYVRLLGQMLDIEFEAKPYPNFSEALEGARNREFDILPGIVAAPERKEYLSFTQPIFETRDRIFTRLEAQGQLTLDDLVGWRVGIVSGYAIQARLQRDHPNIELVLLDTELDGLLALSFGSIDAFISEIGTSSYYIEQEAITNLRIAGEIDGVTPQTFAVRSDLPILHSIISKALAHITPEQHEEIQRRWINIDGADELQRLWQRGGTAVAIILLVLVGVIAWSISLRRIVAARTRELKQELAERARLEADRQRLAVAVEQSAGFVLVMDNSANIEFANVSFEEAFGAADVEGRNFETLANGISRQRLIEALAEARESGLWQGKVVLGNNGETPLKVRMTIVPILDADGSIDGFVATGRDVTKEEQLEARLRQGERLSALGTLAGGIAHDFNNLLVPITGYTDLIRTEGPADLGPYVDGIADASGRARDLVQRIMVFGRGGSGEMVPLDLRYEVEDAIAFLRSLLPKTIALKDNLHECGAVLGDRTQIQQILVNLGTNANDAMVKEGGTLSISLEQRSVAKTGTDDLQDLLPGDYAVLTVTDTGAGMSEATRSRIFDPYFTDKKPGSGTGLGLAIVHSIVSRHNGSIHVQSTPGEGTTFEIYFPTVADEPSSSRPRSSQKMPRGEGQKVMLVDDDQLVLGTVRSMIDGLGYDVSEWSDPVAALDTFLAEPDAFDAVLADFTMPGLNGRQLVHRVLAARADIPVAIMTGNVSAMAGDSIRCIAKPMTLDALAANLEEMLA